MSTRRIVSAVMSVLFALLIAAPVFHARPALASGASGEKPKDEKRIVVSLGDSYSSGEGVEDFYYNNLPMSQRRDKEDWLAHRSERSWAGKLKVPGIPGTLSENKDTSWFFAASSGAVTDNIRSTGNTVVDKEHGTKEGEQLKEYDRDWVWGYKNLPGQLDVFYETLKEDRFEVDYVTITIGGNDVEFVEIIKKAALNTTLFSTELPDFILDKLNHFYDEGSTYYKIKDAYRRIAEAAPNAAIIVAGYPELLDYEGNGALFNKDEADFINRAVRIFNSMIELIVTDCQREGMNIHFAEVVDEFSGHQAYSYDSYINPIYFGAKDQDIKARLLTSSYSMHPNNKGTDAYARCVQKKINELERQTSDERDIVLVLDNSGSMSGTPLSETKRASENFIGTILREDASIGIVSFSDSASMRCDFSMNEEYLKESVQGIWADASTNTESGLVMARDMLRNSSAKKQIIVLMSDGCANKGRTGEELVEYADSLKDEGIIIYTLGFFSSLSSYEKTEAQRIMDEMASPGCHYEVEDADNLVFFFGDIASQINGDNYIYIRIACPVDVRVTYGGETLSSAGYDRNTRTSFGSLTFENNQGSGSSYSSDDRTKVLRLKEEANYEIEITGNGVGTMSYTVRFPDGNGDYTDVREIEDVEITESTRILANADRAEKTTLKVDEDGDGRYERTLTASGGPSRPAKEGLPAWAIVLISLGGAALAALVLVLILRKGKGRRAAVPAGGAPAYAPARAAQPLPPSEWVFCRKCGARLEPGAAFCDNCGTPVGGPAKR